LLPALTTYLALGAAAGLMAGLLGVGGGLIIVPVLAHLFLAQGVEPQVVMHLALGTSLATIIFTSISSVRAHHRRGAVRWPIFWRIVPGILVGAQLGAWLAHLMPGADLRIVFGLFELAVAVQMWFGAAPELGSEPPGGWAMGVGGVVIGTVSAIVGIGGGTLTVPFLVWGNQTMREAVATSAAVGLPIALSGAAGYLWIGLGSAGLPDAAVGYIHLPALLGICLASVLSAPLGAHLAHRLPAAKLKRGFALFLALLGARMLLA